MASNDKNIEIPSIILVAFCIISVVIDILDMIPYFHGFTEGHIPNFTLFVLVLLASYIFIEVRKSIENLSDKAKHTDETVRVLINTIESQQAQGVEIFKSADLLLDKLAIITVGADEVMTLNLSPARGYSNSLDNYFEKVNEYILSKKSKLISFRTLASIDTGKKAKWVWERSILLSPSKKASTALFATKNLQMPIGFHIVVNRAINVPFVFIYPPVSTSGEGVGFLVKNEKISETMIGFFEMLWGKSLKVHLGNEFHKEGLDFLVDLCPDIKDTKEYAQIINNIS